MPNSSSTHHVAGLSLAKKRVVAFIAAVALALLVLVVVLQSSSRPAYAASDLLPDLEMAPLQDVHIEKTSNGRRLLRFTAIIVNDGSGPLELRGRRRRGDRPTMKVSQRIFDDAGGYRDVPTKKATMKWSVRSYPVWRVNKLQSYVLKRLDDGSKVAASPKKLFCLHDHLRYGSTQPPYYTHEQTCGNSPKNRRVLMGLSVDWSDHYAYDEVAYMYVDIKGLAAGDYRLEATADPTEWYLEEDDTNNLTWVDLRLTTNGDLQILGHGPHA